MREIQHDNGKPKKNQVRARYQHNNGTPRKTKRDTNVTMEHQKEPSVREIPS